jgi:AhpC/TSA family protein
MMSINDANLYSRGLSETKKGTYMNKSPRMRTVFGVLLLAILLLFSGNPVMAVQVGDKAPDFSLPATTAEKVSLADFIGKKPVVVFFYVYAFTNT